LIKVLKKQHENPEEEDSSGSLELS
jgi:hypothetical protein